MNKARVQIAKPDIIAYFNTLPDKVLKHRDIAAILSQHRGFWRLTQNMTTQMFIDFLTQHTKLKRLDFPFPYRKEIRYVWGEIPLLTVLLTLKKDAYFTHYTAVRMHGLTEQIPKTIYLNHEQLPHDRSVKLEQKGIDLAFRSAQRISHNVIDYEDVRITLINGMYTGQLGVIEQDVTYDNISPVRVRLTEIERTLIDITVRPVYAGGVFEVLKAFQLARDRISVNRLTATLQNLDFVYPYHQAIGFYLERAGYKPAALDLLRSFEIEFDFFLSHKMGATEYVKDWRLFIPKGF